MDKEEREREKEREGGEKTEDKRFIKTKAVVDDSKSCEYELIILLFHLILTHCRKIHIETSADAK